jgi:hypothetical protein
MRIDELEAHERNVLGGLLRMMVRSDGDFQEAEEAAIDALGEGIGGRDAIWKIISDSAQALTSDASIKDAVPSVTRAPARSVILAALEKVAAPGSVVPKEQSLLDFVTTSWSRG